VTEPVPGSVVIITPFWIVSTYCFVAAWRLAVGSPERVNAPVIVSPALATAPRLVKAVAATEAPVPPFAIGSVPVTPILVVKAFAYVVEPRFAWILVIEVNPVPPFYTGNVPVTPIVVAVTEFAPAVEPKFYCWVTPKVEEPVPPF